MSHSDFRPWWLYIIRCSDNSLYTGISTDVEKRFQDHQSQNRKSAKYVRGKTPLTLVFKQSIGSKSEASKAEYRVKRLRKSQKEQLITQELSLEALLDH